MYQLTVVKYNIPFKALPVLVCMKRSTRGVSRAVFFIHTRGSALTITLGIMTHTLNLYAYK